tara:strand:+ start:482 stop:2650 length:2169 start_codon:yes stop_codon:yes gene_type:complete
MNNLLKSAIDFYQNKQFVEAEKICQNILDLDSNNFDAINLLAAISFQNKSFSKSIELFKKACKINPNKADLYNNLSIAYMQEKNFKEAIWSWDEATKLKPNFFQAYFGKGNAYSDLKDYSNAINNFKKAIEINKNYKEAYNNLGTLYANLKDYKNALIIFKKAVLIKPVHFNEFNNLGNVYYELNKYKDSIENYNLAIKINPDFALTYYNKAKALQKVNFIEESIINYEKAISLNKNFSEAYQNLGNIYMDLKILDKSIYNHKKALKINPGIKFLLGTIIQSKYGMCDWDNFEYESKFLEKEILGGKKSASPFSTLLIYDSPSLQLKSSNIFLESEFQASNWTKKEKVRNKKIRVAYYSSDFHNHATMYLMANLFELHDKSKFEIYAFSFGPDDNSQIRKRVIKTFDKFIDVKQKTIKEIVEISRNENIDIAVDLKGFTKDNRFELFIKRCAPIQISYLGFPGTTGSNCIDYIVADKIVIPDQNKKYYSENIIYLPNSYQVNDATLSISEKNFTRKEFGLPENSFVYSCFNNTYKILPEMFYTWCKILDKVKNSVLWLLADNDIAKTNLKKILVSKGIDQNRLIFASRMKHSEHLARLKLADLFLDTFPCNAHTTASDSIRSCLPIITLRGKSFASRVTSSLLSSVGLDKLITDTKQVYEELAIKIAMDNNYLSLIKNELKNNIKTKPLLNTSIFTKNLERAYFIAYEKYINNKKPDNIEIN